MMLLLTTILVTSLLTACQGSPKARRQDEVHPAPTADYDPCVVGGPRYYPHHSDPHKFIDCGDGAVPYLKTCPRHLVWNPVPNYCDYPENVAYTLPHTFATHPPVNAQGPGISGNHIYATNFAAPCTLERIRRNQLYWPYPGYIHYYILCDAYGDSLVMACLPNHVYYEPYQSCVATQSAGSTQAPIIVTRPPTTAGSGSGTGATVSGWHNALYSTGFQEPCTSEHVQSDKLYWPFPDSAHFYIQCDLFGDAYLMACQPGFSYSQDSHTCVGGYTFHTWIPAATTSAFTQPTIDPGVGGPVVGSVFSVGFAAPCTQDAVSRRQMFWPYPGYSYVYLECDLSGNAVVQACQAGYIFFQPAHDCINVTPVG